MSEYKNVKKEQADRLIKDLVVMTRNTLYENESFTNLLDLTVRSIVGDYKVQDNPTNDEEDRYWSERHNILVKALVKLIDEEYLPSVK